MLDNEEDGAADHQNCTDWGEPFDPLTVCTVCSDPDAHGVMQIPSFYGTRIYTENTDFDGTTPLGV